MRKKVLVARAVFPAVVERLKQYFDVEFNSGDDIFSETELIHKLRDVDGVFTTSSERVSATTIAACPALKAICNMAVGYNNIDLDAATRAGVVVTNTPDVLNETTADL
jgi:glyoxylate/hydroxypyruvate/2-ketogluconate reductase